MTIPSACSNPDELYSPTVCRAFHQRLSLRLPELPPLPEWSDPAPPPAPDSSQGTLL